MHYLNRNVDDDELLNILEDILSKFQSEDVFITRTARQFIWGYQDPALALLKEFIHKFFHIDVDPTVGATSLHKTMPPRHVQVLNTCFFSRYIVRPQRHE